MEVTMSDYGWSCIALVCGMLFVYFALRLLKRELDWQLYKRDIEDDDDDVTE